MQTKKQLVLPALLLIAIVWPWSASAAPAEVKEFQFNRKVSVIHAKAALEDYTTLMAQEKQLAEVDFTKAYTAAVMSKDCSDKVIKLVLVAFPDKKGSGLAFSSWEQNRDGLISQLLAVGFTMQDWETLIKQARSGSSIYCE